VSGVTADPSYTPEAVDTVTGTTANFYVDANNGHKGSVSFDIGFEGRQSGDTVKVELFKVGSSTAVASNTFTSGSNDYTFNNAITSSGEYYLKVTATDKSVSGDLREVTLSDVKVFAYNYGPQTTKTSQTVNINVLDQLAWVAAIAASGNVFPNDDKGSEGATLTDVASGSTHATWVGNIGTIVTDDGTLSINKSTGDYTFTPKAGVETGGNTVEFTYTLEQADGDTDTATLTIDIADHDYTVATAGNDYLRGGAGDDVLSGGGGNDYIVGGDGNDVLSGGDGNDYIVGGAGDDVLSGGKGNDILTGGLGADTFVWTLADIGTGDTTATDASNPSKIAVDVVTDFNRLEGDVLDLSNVLDGGGKEVIGISDNGKLGLQIVDSSNADKVYQQITLEGIAFGSDEAAAILNNLKDHGTSSDS
jgi:surface adhesion protein